MNKGQILERIQRGVISVDDLVDPESQDSVKAALHELFPDMDLSKDIVDVIIENPEMQRMLGRPA